MSNPQLEHDRNTRQRRFQEFSSQFTTSEPHVTPKVRATEKTVTAALSECSDHTVEILSRARSGGHLGVLLKTGDQVDVLRLGLPVWSESYVEPTRGTLESHSHRVSRSRGQVAMVKVHVVGKEGVLHGLDKPIPRVEAIGLHGAEDEILWAGYGHHLCRPRPVQMQGKQHAAVGGEGWHTFRCLSPQHRRQISDHKTHAVR
mmetsp:Transcript_7752/g.21204  ORF Transcript_7752/g.21204 Transcript_7752/m.21204 type:complete len:202 (-) Transcript_7752:1399-2004(-)